MITLNCEKLDNDPYVGYNQLQLSVSESFRFAATQKGIRNHQFALISPFLNIES